MGSEWNNTKVESIIVQELIDRHESKQKQEKELQDRSEVARRKDMEQ